MDFLTFLIIPIIALIVWFLQYIFKEPEDKNRARPRAQGAPPRQVGNRPRRQSTDLDRFLEETRRRKQGGEEREPVVVAELVPENPRPEMPPERPLVSSKENPPPPRRSEARKERKPERSRERDPEPVAIRPSLRVYEPAPTVTGNQPQPAPKAATPPPERVREIGTRPSAEQQADAIGRIHHKEKTPPSAALVEILRLVRSPLGLKSSLVLREIFEGPLCKRRGRR